VPDHAHHAILDAHAVDAIELVFVFKLVIFEFIIIFLISSFVIIVIIVFVIDRFLERIFPHIVKFLLERQPIPDRRQPILIVRQRVNQFLCRPEPGYTDGVYQRGSARQPATIRGSDPE
jgi:hypothetical protein